MQSAAFRGHPNYSHNGALAISDAELRRYGVNHRGVNSLTSVQQRLNAQFRADVRAGIRTNSMREQTRLALQTLVEAGVPPIDAIALVIRARRHLRQMGVRAPTRIPQ
jgi:hypothetical protein